MREETGSSSISVKLTDEKLKFVAGKPLKVNNANASDSVWWVDEDQGAMKPITGDTKITYLVSTLVMPDEKVPKLLCYDTCPDPGQDGRFDHAESIDTKEYVSYLNSATATGGKCKTKPESKDIKVRYTLL